ncbi:hypothetical protein KE423_003913 [Salmonella enterica]|nr:hypothetical protein [Salmonella enterica]
MKKLIALSALAAALAATSPAHAISDHYRAQLERSGCTQQTDGHGCDIHKTAAENHDAALKDGNRTQAQKDRAALNASLEDNVLAAPVEKALSALKALGFRQVKGEYVNPNGDRVIIDVDHGGSVRGVTVKP